MTRTSNAMSPFVSVTATHSDLLGDGVASSCHIRRICNPPRCGSRARASPPSSCRRMDCPNARSTFLRRSGIVSRSRPHRARCRPRGSISSSRSSCDDHGNIGVDRILGADRSPSSSPSLRSRMISSAQTRRWRSSPCLRRGLAEARRVPRSNW